MTDLDKMASTRQNDAGAAAQRGRRGSAPAKAFAEAFAKDLRKRGIVNTGTPHAMQMEKP